LGSLLDSFSLSKIDVIYRLSLEDRMEKKEQEEEEEEERKEMKGWNYCRIFNKKTLRFLNLGSLIMFITFPRWRKS